MSVLNKSINDYFSGKFLGFSFLIFLVPLVLFGILLMLGVGEVLDMLVVGADTGDFSFLNQEEHPFWAGFLKLAVVKWLVGILLYSFGAFFVVLFSLFSAMVILGFLTPMVVKTIHKKYYYDTIELKPMDNAKAYKILALNILKFLGLLFVCILFSWIPFVINLPFFYLFYKLMIHDVASNMMSEERFEDIKRRIFTKLLTLSICFFLLSLIPVAGIFLQLFFVIYFTHIFFIELLPYQTRTRLNEIKALENR